MVNESTNPPTPGYTYEVTATDGAPGADSFHVKVWDPDGSLLFDLSGPVVAGSGDVKATAPN